MTTSEAVAQLKKLSAKAGDLLFDRAKLAEQILGDAVYIEESFEGDRDKALATIEADYFGELSLGLGLKRLLVLIRTFRERKEWAEAKYNFETLWALYEERRRAAEGDKLKVEQERFTKKEKEKLDQKVKELEFAGKQTQAALTTASSEVDRLKQENAELKAENRLLREQMARYRGDRLSA